LRWAPHDQVTAVFDPDTGETHFLSELPLLILTQIKANPTSLSELINRLDGPADLAPGARQQIHQALLSLEQAELLTSEITDSV
jgi:PqqD family protein of HPr-rel-A system